MHNCYNLSKYLRVLGDNPRNIYLFRGKRHFYNFYIYYLIIKRIIKRIIMLIIYKKISVWACLCEKSKSAYAHIYKIEIII